MSKDNERDTDAFKSQEQIKSLKSKKDRRWRKLARADLKALAEDPDGLDLIAKAIQAVLRQDKSPKKKKEEKKKRW